MDSLIERILTFIDSAIYDDQAFNDLALAIFTRQYRLIEPYRRFCDTQNASPDNVTDWRQIPAAPVAAFKQFDLSCVPLPDAKTVYYSSGTTGPSTSKHYMDDAAVRIYYASLKRGFYNVSSDFKNLPIWAIMQTPANAPNSSLSAMLGALNAERFYWDNNEELYNDLAGLNTPIILFGTAFAFVGYFDSTPERQQLRLPKGSIIVETGGFKGRSREISREELYGLFETRLGVRENDCYSEYGMSEMASQFYSNGLNPVKYGPPWVRTRIIDPITRTEANPEEKGLLAHYDLANYNSLIAIQTEDMGVFKDTGFILLGRVENAEIRGCSLTMEELWNRRITPS